MPAASRPLVIIAGVPGAGQRDLARALRKKARFVEILPGLQFRERVGEALDSGHRVVVCGVAGPEPGLRLILDVTLAFARERSSFYRNCHMSDRRFAGLRRANSEQIAGLTSPETDVVIDGELPDAAVRAQALAAIKCAGFLDV